MAKKLSKSRKKTTKVTKKNNSLLNKIFGFPKFIIYAFVVLVVLLVYQVSLPSAPSTDVKGASTTADDISYTRDEAIAAVKKEKAANIPIDKYIAVRLWKDDNGNGKQDNWESCLKKDFTVKKNDKTKTATQGNCSVEARLFKVTKNCNTMEFVKTNTTTQYVYTGMYVDAGNYRHGKYLKSKKVTVCGFTKSDGGDGWGYEYNEVDFEVKAK